MNLTINISKITIIILLLFHCQVNAFESTGNSTSSDVKQQYGPFLNLLSRLIQRFIKWLRLGNPIDRTLSPVPVPSSVPDPNQRCLCKSCSEAVWNKLAGEYTCGDRIEYLWMQLPNQYPTEESACKRIARIEFPNECSSCDSERCDGKIYSSCGCQTCTKQILQRNAGDFTCQERIDWLLLNDAIVGGSEEKACKMVSNEYSTICGPDCHPDKCSQRAPASVPAPTIPTIQTPTSANLDLYCFPPPISRKKYENVWGNLTIEVKESLGVCGPGDNMFSTETLSLSGNDLMLQFKNVNGKWTGSEVRVLLPSDQMPFKYGTYSFSIKKVSWKRNNVEISKELPPSLVLGLFTWDPTEDYSIRENYNHEVDIEISRWNDKNAMDGQFLVQPPGNPQMYRFYTGLNNTRDPGGQRYQFTWNPGEIIWYSAAGGGHLHKYSTKQTIESGLTDYVQCLPANVEIRLNLWNMFGTQQPTDMTNSDEVEVVIDSVTYVPSGLTGIRDGNYCTKNCQCQLSSTCRQNICKPL